jgi:2-oxoglutarate ferredoxin oxidoreductase subunit alpha
LNEDFVATRTLPGSDEKGAYFIRGSGHDKYGHYTESPPQYQEVVDRLKLKHAASAAYVPAPIVERREHATIGVITVGSCDLAVREALTELADAGVPCDYMRIRGFPFVDDVPTFVAEHDHCFVVEQNRDAQLRSLIAIETGLSTESMHPVLNYGGFPLSAQQVVESVLAKLEN